MGTGSDYLEDKVLDHIVGKTAYTMPADVYIALCTADPTDAGTGASMNEVADANNYARVDTDGDWNAASGGSISNANAFTFPEASGSWGTVTHFALVDSGTHGAGNMLAHGSLDVSKAVGNKDTISFAGGTPGEIVITLD